MNRVRVRQTFIGEGKPKIVVPIVAGTEAEVDEQVKEARQQKADMLEWRGDWFDGIFDWERVENVLRQLRKYVGEMPVLFTFRTANEGGEKEISRDEYRRLNIEVAKSQMADLIDVEGVAFENADSLIEELKELGSKVIVSSHDFNKTPQKNEMIGRLCEMQKMGADIVKLAVMPQSVKDVLELLAATEEMNRLYAKQPIVTMSMAGQGVISRLAGELVGSAMTFGTAGKASAPGQIDVKELDFILTTIHNQLR